MILVFFIFMFLILIFIISKLKLKICINNFNINTEKMLRNYGSIFLNITLGNRTIITKKTVIKKVSLLKIYNKKSHKINIKIFENRTIKKILRKMNFRIDKLNMELLIGTNDCILTSYLVSFFSIITSIVLTFLCNKNSNLNDYKYEIYPVYNKYYANFKLNCIITVNLVHIICIIFLIWKGSRKNERTSNRKSYEYSYE